MTHTTKRSGDHSSITLPADSNQALGIARFAIDFVWGGESADGGGCDPDQSVLDRTEMFYADACLCGVSALALGTNAPNILRREALESRATIAGTGNMSAPGAAKNTGATVYGSNVPVMPEKAIAANSAAVREWDSNGTNFGYSLERPHHRAGEFGHNDFYAVPIAAAQMMGKDGAFALRGMVLLDEVRGRLAEVFSLKSYKIDHVVHGAIASAATFGAMLKATPEQIESAIGMVVAHYIPFRAIRAGKQLSDSKGASAAISTEAAILSVRRSMAGFLGPRDIFRNPEAVFRLFEGPGQLFQKIESAGTGIPEARAGKSYASPFDLVLSRAGTDFAVMGMHFKLGLYEHQSAGALQGLIDLVHRHPQLLANPTGAGIAKIVVKAYEPAFGIIGDPAKRDPGTRQSADHSMLYLVCTMLRKMLEFVHHRSNGGSGVRTSPDWSDIMLLPHDFGPEALHHPLTRSLMAKMAFEWGGPEYDAGYPDGIPTSMAITDDAGEVHDSGLVMYPGGHARNTTANLKAILAHKFASLATLSLSMPSPIGATSLISRFTGIGKKSSSDIAQIHNFPLRTDAKFD